MLQYALVVLQISRKSNKARVSYIDFKKCYEKMEKEKKNAKKIRRTVMVHISGMARQIQLKFEIGGSPPQGNLYKKISFVSVKGESSYICVKMAFSLFLYNAHLSIVRSL